MTDYCRLVHQCTLGKLAFYLSIYYDFHMSAMHLFLFIHKYEFLLKYTS